jgi:hypothetical protein
MKNMSKFIIGVIVILAVGAIALSVNNILPGEKVNDADNIHKGDLINFQLYKTYEVDTSGFYERFHIVEGTPFTDFVQAYNLDRLRKIGNYREVYSKLPAFDDVDPNDYQDKFLAVSFGRKVVEMEVIKEAVPPSKSVEAAITFSEEYHA